MSAPAVQVQGLKKGYRGRSAVRDVSFTIGEGEIFGLLGPNGAGKTTTLGIVSTLCPADEGTVAVMGVDLGRHPRRVKAMIGIVPQDLALYGRLSARQNLQFFGEIYGLFGRDLRRRCDEILSRIGLRNRENDPVDTLSGGMKRRLNVGVALVHRPRVLFLDEPTVGLDPQSRHFVFEFIEGLRSEQTTILYTTHYMEEAQRLCDRVAIMDQGQILATASPRSLILEHGEGVIRVTLEPVSGVTELAAWTGLNHVVHCSSTGDQLVLKTREVQSTLLELIQRCREQGQHIASLEVLAPNLETVFLQLTGRRLRS